MEPQDFQGVESVVLISTDTGTRCNHCEESIGAERFEESINHYLKKHGYRILHVGQETSRDDLGNPWQSTVAVLGK